MKKVITTAKSVVTLDKLSGYRTYIAAYGLMAFGFFALFTGKMTPEQAIPMILGAAGIAGLRAGLDQSKTTN